MEMFGDTRFRPEFDNVLDIGCGMGVHLRLLKAWGVVKQAEGVDIYDVASGFDVDGMRHQQRRFKMLRYAEWLQDRIERVRPADSSAFQNAVMKRAPTAKWFGDNYGRRPGKGIYDQSFRNDPTIDNLIIGNVYDLEGQYDLVTSFASLDWFALDEIMPKVSSLLRPGGFFYVWVTNWWHNINTTNIFGHVPFASQRLPKEEFMKYAAEQMPDNLENIEKSYTYFDPAHPTLSDYVESASRVGLVPLNWDENIMPGVLGAGGGVNSLGIAEHDLNAFTEAFEDCQEMHPNLRMTDMYPFSRSMLFYKPEDKGGLTYDTLDTYRQERDFHYTPSNPVGKAAKYMAERILLRNKPRG